MSKLLDYFKEDELAANVWLDKYADVGEETPDDMHKRLVDAFYPVEKKIIYDRDLLSKYGQSRDTLSKEDLARYFNKFRYIVPQGSIMSVLGTNKIASLSNCFVIGQPEDSYGGIMLKDQQLAQLMKRRGGVGLDLSTLRPVGTPVSNAAGSSTGLPSFMERYSNTTREVAQDGRRGALMLTADVRHPDILGFINSKKDRTKVTGANISVMLRDDFMDAVQLDKDYILRFPCDLKLERNEIEQYKLGYGELFQFDKGKYVKRVKAKDVYNAIVENAWDNAEPGQMFVDTHWSFSPDGVYDEYKMVTTNPCGEIGMSTYDACRLLAMNLYSMVRNPFTNEAYLDLELVYRTAYDQLLLADRIVDLELKQIVKILDKIDDDPESDESKTIEYDLWGNIFDVAQNSRRTGCGFTALGDMFAAMNQNYGDKDSREILTKVMRAKMAGELDATIDLAIKYGPFHGWDPNKEFELLGDNLVGKNEFFEMLVNEFPLQAWKMFKYGRRNVSWSTVAPTGSVSILTQTTSGLEPLWSWGYMRRKKVNPGENVRVDFVDQNGDSWTEFPVLHPKFKDWIITTSNFKLQSKYQLVEHMPKDVLQTYFESSPWYRNTANDINWDERLQIQSIIQYYTTHSISSTINLPNSVTKEEVSEIYIKAHDYNLKGVTIYRDGCRTGVLVSTNDSSNSNNTSTIDINNATKRPTELRADIYNPSIKGTKYTVLVGMLGDIPYEVFAFQGDPEFSIKEGTDNYIKKNKKKEWVVTDAEGNEFNIVAPMIPAEETITRMTSGMLRHNIPLKYIVEILNKNDDDITNFSKVIARTLKRYINDGETSTLTCEKCGEKSIIFEEGCLKCLSCGSSKCG